MVSLLFMYTNLFSSPLHCSYNCADLTLWTPWVCLNKLKLMNKVLAPSIITPIQIIMEALDMFMCWLSVNVTAFDWNTV